LGQARPPTAVQAAAKPLSAQAPVNSVPITNQSEDEQQESDQQQTGCFRGINRVPLMLAGGVVIALSVHHGFIVRRAEITGAIRLRRVRRGCGLVLHYASSVVTIVYARFPRQSLR
jgi:hypothetical protein